MAKSTPYPETLRNELAKFGISPTFDIEWDREVLHLLNCQKTQASICMQELSPLVAKSLRQQKEQASSRPDLADPDVFSAHLAYWLNIADTIVLSPQNRRFVLDDNNRAVIHFLLYYFNECPLAESVFPSMGHKLHKNIMLQGPKGVGKTLIMQIFSEYLISTRNPRAFKNVSVTQLVNHFSLHNNINLYIYNEDHDDGFKINPHNLCLNDIGVENRPFYGIDTLTVVSDFLHARNELWSNHAITDRKFAHLTTNLDTQRLKEMFSAKDPYGRIVDRFKTYNVIPVTGNSRR